MSLNKGGKSKRNAESPAYMYVALAADVAVAIAKLVVGLLAGSTAMLAEAAHSFADSTNQVFLLIGVKLSDRPADEQHPYGHGKERVFWAFLAAIFIFVSGALFSLYQGIQRIVAGEQHEGSFWPSYLVLGLALLFDVGSLVITWWEVDHRAQDLELDVVRFLRDVPAMTLKTTFYSDIAAVLGVVIAAIGIALLQATGNAVFDGLASVVIGLILIAVALILGLGARDLLLGSAASPRTQQQIRGAIESFPEVAAIVELLTMRLGLRSVLVTGEIAIRDGLTTDEIEQLLLEVTKRIRDVAPEVKNIYLEPHPIARDA